MKTRESTTILLVEDELENRRILTEILSDLGYKVIDEPDGLSALSVLQRGLGIDLVITDFRMPDMNGLELIRTIRETVPSLPVILMTAYGNIENYFRSMNLGVFEYITKPMGKREFERIVKAALEETKAA